VVVAYVTAAESDVYLAAYADWLALDTLTKDSHLSWGRIYIDSVYSCDYDETDATDAIKHANSLAGYANFSGTLYTDAPLVSGSSVTAGSVSSAKTYAAGYRPTDPLLKQARALLEYDCVSTGGGSTIGLSRN